MTTAKNRQLYIGLIVAIAVLGLALDWFGYMTPVRNSVQRLLTPFEAQISQTAQGVSRRIESSVAMQELQARNAELEALANSLMVENVRLKDLERENEILRQLLNYTRNNPQFTYETTTVKGRSIGRDPTNLLHFVYVDVGARDGVARNMPVVTDRGLVGRVAFAGTNTAQVLLLTDPSSSVNAIIQNSRAGGVVKGDIDGVTLTMERILPSAEVNPGDIVLTSGLGGNFPDKIVIGQVTEVTRRDQDMFQIARIRPTVDFGKLETMLVVTSFEPVDFESEILEAQERQN